MARWPGIQFALAAAVAALAIDAAGARELAPVDALAEFPPAAKAKAQREDPRLGRAHYEERLGLPTFAWLKPVAGERAKSMSIRAPEEAARLHLAGVADLYALTSAEIDAATVHHVDVLQNGAYLVKFISQRDGVEVFRESAAVLMDASKQPIVIGGFIASTTSASVLAKTNGPAFRLAPPEAVAVALSDYGFEAPIAGELMRAPETKAHYAAGFEHFALPKDRMSSDGASLSEPARAKRVWFRLPGGLVPGYYVELQMAESGTRDVDYYAYVIAADDGRVLFRVSQSADVAFTYKVWAENGGIGLPYPGPQGRNATPHPTALNDGYQAPFVPQNDLTLQNGPISTNDPWLPADATRTIGNNVEAWANHTGASAPDGVFDPDPAECDMAAPQAADLHACLSAPGTFNYVFDPAIAPKATKTQVAAAVVNLFYVTNWLHDWYYDAGFREIDGNAQSDNYGRGGIGNDSMKAQAQDFAGTNNANMSTPADGARPRMRMYLFTGTGAAAVSSTPTGNVAAGTAVFGPAVFDTSLPVILVTDGVGTTTDGCQPIANSVVGAIALVDRGGCTFKLKALNVQNAGAAGLIVANNVAGVLTMGDDATITTAITTPLLMVSNSDGAVIKSALLAGPVTARLLRILGVDRDGAVDNSIIAHEWGHYISNRLIANASGLTTTQARGMGEGWADFHALMMMVKAGDSLVAANANFNGTYTIAGYVTDGPQVAGVTKSHAYYDGFRRYPYSTDLSKDPLNFRHVQTGVALPTTPPPAFAGDNAEVHATGEVWASMLWDCYASLLRDTGRLTFAQAQDRMKRYLVAGYKLTPANPNFVEARDALFAAIAAGDPADLPGCVSAFAQRGLGLHAAIGDRFSGTNAGVVESFTAGNDLQIAALDFDGKAGLYCDADRYLDNGETGKFLVTVRNTGAATLDGIAVSVSSASAGVTFPGGASRTLPPLAPFASTVAAFDVALNGAGPVSVATLDASASHGSLAFPGAVSASLAMPTQRQSVAAISASDDVESDATTWVSSLQGAAAPTLAWTRVTVSNLDHHWNGPTGEFAGVAWLTSPPLQVVSGAFTMSFRHRHVFEWGSSGNFDGGVVEISGDNGATWTDVGALAGAAFYNGGALSTGTTNPLAGRAAYVGESAGYPAYATKSVTFPPSYFGQTVLVRFGVATDASGHLPGWDVDDIAFTGISNSPFAGYTDDPHQCVSAAATGGTPQTANASTAFAAALQLRVLSYAGSPVAGAWVTFSAPPSGASGAFSPGGASVSVQTDAAGYATTASFIANTVAGSYNVTANAGLANVSFALTNLAPPSAPTGVAVTPGNGHVTISFTAPSSTGGSPVTSYTAQCTGGGATFSNTGSSSPIVVGGLANGVAYSCSVSASNAIGTGTASGAIVVTPTASGVPSDFNADGHPDILWSNTTNGATYVWHMTGPPPMLANDAFVAQIDPSWKVQGVADFNGDGHPDLIWRNTANGNTYVWYMDGASFVSDAFVFSLPPQWVIQGVADFNADGKPDFLMRNTDPASGVGFVWFFNNNVPIGDQFLFGIDPAWKVEQVGDMNGDGQPDLLFRNMTSGLAFAWYTQYSGGNLSLAGSSAPIFSIDPVWEIVQLADWNGDGNPDLLFRNASSGVVFVWYMTGTTLGGSDYVIQIDPSWEIVPRR